MMGTAKEKKSNDMPCPLWWCLPDKSLPTNLKHDGNSKYPFDNADIGKVFPNIEPFSPRYPIVLGNDDLIILYMVE
jgi:hypothetical protein